MKKTTSISRCAFRGFRTALAMLIVLLLTSCTGQNSTQSIQTSTRHTIVDMAGRQVELPKEINKVYSTGQPGVFMLYTLCPDRLLGWCLPVSSAEGAYLNPRYLSLPVLGLMQGNNGTANREEIIARHPDMILLMTGLTSTTVSTADEIQENMGIPVVVADYALENSGKTYRFLGELMDVQERAETLADYCERVYDGAKKFAKTIPEKGKITVYYAQGTNGLQTAPAGSSHSEVLDLVGAINVVKLQAQSDGRLTINIEQLLEYDPDMILFSYSMGHEGTDMYSNEGTLTTISGMAAWKGLKAVKKGMVYSTPCYPYNWLDMPPSANRIIGIRWLESLIYPEYYDGDISVETREFYRLFYQKDLKDSEIDALLKNARRN